MEKASRRREIPLSALDDFPEHPFAVRMDEDMEELVQSVRERGVLVPLIVRPKESGRFEIISGHRRKRACELAGIPEVPCDVREMSRDEAIICMVDANLQRSRILPSEKAFAYRMKLEAMKRIPGRPTKENCGQLGHNYEMQRTRDILAGLCEDSGRQIQRYIRLTYLEPEILQRVDEGQIALRPAVELSYLAPEEQSVLTEEMRRTDATPSYSQASRMRRVSRSGRLTEGIIRTIMDEEKPNQGETLRIRYEDARRYMPPGVPYEQTGEYIFRAMAFYRRHLERDRGSYDRDNAR